MHIGINRIYIINRNIAWHQSVEFVSQLCIIEIGFGLEMRSHASRMHTGICTSCTDHLYILTQYCRKSFLQFFLNRIAIGLYLPAMISRTVVGKCYKVALHLKYVLYKLIGFLLGAIALLEQSAMEIVLSLNNQINL